MGARPNRPRPLPSRRRSAPSLQITLLCRFPCKPLFFAVSKKRGSRLIRKSTPIGKNHCPIISTVCAATAARFSELEVGQLVEGQVAAIKPYGLFIDLGGVSGLLHQSMITGGSLRSLREVFGQGDTVRALITELDPGRGRIGLNTALLEGQPGELLADKDTVMAEAEDRANRARNVLRQQEQSAG